jgi:multidrug efflux pump
LQRVSDQIVSRGNRSRGLQGLFGIVEFAKQQREAGVPRRKATLEGSRLRLRPILMTSFAFIFGVVPLVVATGAGAEMRQSLGQAVFSDMSGVTLFGVFPTPVFF